MTILFWGNNLEPAPCTLVLAMIVTTTMRIAIEVVMILMVTMVVRMTMMIAIKVPMI